MENNIGNEPEKTAKVFTEEDVNRIVTERLRKEREKQSGLLAMKSAVLSLKKGGYFDGLAKSAGRELSIFEMTQAALGDLDKNKFNTDFDRNGQNADYHKSEDLQSAVKAEEGRAAYPDIIETEQTRQSTGGNNIPGKNNMVESDRNPSISSPPSAPSYYERALAAYSSAPQQQTAQNEYPSKEIIQRQYEGGGYNDSYSSAETHRSGDGFMLTERQRELARAGGMTYREYYESIKSIPVTFLFAKRER